MVTNIYVDAFNLYYGCLKGTQYRWLDLAKLCQVVFPHNQINRIRYFTAVVDARPPDLQQPVRQQIYVRALETLPGLSVHYGQYRTRTTRMHLAKPPLIGAKTAEVLKTEGKGVRRQSGFLPLVGRVPQGLRRGGRRLERCRSKGANRDR